MIRRHGNYDALHFDYYHNYDKSDHFDVIDSLCVSVGRSTSSIGQRTLTSLGPGVARGHDPIAAPQFVRRVQSNEALFKTRFNAGPAGGYSVQGGVDGRHGKEQWSTSGQEEVFSKERKNLIGILTFINLILVYASD